MGTQSAANATNNATNVVINNSATTQAGPDDTATVSTRHAAFEMAGRLVARSGREVIHATEHLICGAGAVRSRAVAEGLALAGHRAATLLPAPGAQTAPGAGAATAAPWVDHRIRVEQPVAGRQAGFELVAATAQDAVDHCLVAHRLAARLRMPAICTVDRRTADGLHLVHIPSREVCRDLLDDAAVRAEAGEPEAALTAALEAFEAVSARTGRGCRAVDVDQGEDAEYVLVTAGAAGAEARAIAEALRREGVACALVTVALLRPFPQEELTRVFDPRQKIAVIEPVPAAQECALVGEVRAALAAAKPDNVCAVRYSGEGAEDLAARVRSAFGLTPAAEETASPAGPVLSSEDRFVLGAVPAGAWSRGFLLDAAALLGRLETLWIDRPEPGFSRASTLVVGRGEPDQTPPASFDLLFVANPSLYSVEGPARRVRKGGTILLAARAESPEAVWSSLSDAQRELITRRELHLQWIDASAVQAAVAETPDVIRTALCGALLASAGSLSGWLGKEAEEEDLVAAIVDSASEPTRWEELLLRDGADALQPVTPSETDAAAVAEEADFRPSQRLPRLAAAVEGEPASEWREALHHFHLTGEGGYSAAEPFPALPLEPAVMAPLVEQDRQWREYPLVVPANGDAAGPAAGLYSLVSEALEKLAGSGKQALMLRDHVARLAQAAGWVVESRGDHAPLTSVLDDVWSAFAREFDLSEAGAGALEEEIALLKARLPESGTLFGLGEQTLLTLCATAVHQDRKVRIDAFLGEVRSLVKQLTELLQLDASRGPEGTSAETFSATLGGGNAFIDPTVLAKSMPAHRGTRRQTAERRARIEGILATLKRYCDKTPGDAEFVLVHPGLLPEGLELPSARVVEHADSLGVAVGLFDGFTAELVEVLRAVRIARLEIQEAYNPELHDEMLERFDWQGFTAEELRLVPPVVVLESCERLLGSPLASFSELLLSGRPIRVLVTENATGPRSRETWEVLAGYHPGLGYLAVAHREAFVVQSTLARPIHLLSSLRDMVQALRPAVAVVAVPSWSAPISALLQVAAAHEGRATPCFRYDPEAGSDWADRFDLEANPEPEQVWPVHHLAYLDDSESVETLETAFTFAHVAALDPAYREHLRVIPREAWSEEQIEIAGYLAAVPEERPNLLPFIWVEDEQGMLARAVMTRELAFACHDRMRAWHTLQELAGADNEYARRAAETARRDALAQAEEARRELEAAHAVELEQVRKQTAGEAMESLVAVLMDFAAGPPAAAPAAAPGPAAAAPAVAAPEPEPVVEEAEEEEEAVSFDEPFIETELCSACNDCTNINNRLFKYNDNKQATIADPAAGTFQQLVAAAEKCPSRCIHPGRPRPGDDTATDELITKAARFN
ncbi:MAG: hypothetical protein GY856_34850 [bacterium]|nr:hypothetical protein [bacterium]